jgi:CcmD family protein
MEMTAYLTAAFMAIWILLAVYLFLLNSREKKLRGEIQRLKRLLGKSSTQDGRGNGV